MIFGGRGEALEIDTFLLSCRVLGRGVEHRMLNELGEIARRRQLSLVAATLIPTKKNQPARDFLEEVAASYRRQVDGGWRYEIPAEVAAAVAYSPGTTEGATASDAGRGRSDGRLTPAARRPRARQRFERIATELSLPEQVLEAIHARSGRRRARPELGQPLIPPRTEIEAELAEIWAELLRLEPVGIRGQLF